MNIKQNMHKANAVNQAQSIYKIRFSNGVESTCSALDSKAFLAISIVKLIDKGTWCESLIVDIKSGRALVTILNMGRFELIHFSQDDIDNVLASVET